MFLGLWEHKVRSNPQVSVVKRKEVQRMKAKKRTKRGRRGLMITGIVVLAAAILLMLFLLMFQVRKIEVTGNTYISENEVVQWIQLDPYGSNSFYLWAKYKYTEPTQHSSLEAVEVKLKNPWTLSVRVYEKKMVGFVCYGNDFVYFDREGKVLAKDQEFRDGVPLIEGLTVSGAELYEILPVEDETIFNVILEATQMLAKYEVTADRIVSKDSELYLYFDSICVQIGNSNLENRVIQIPPILEKLDGKRGLLHLESYQNNDSMISFEENVWPEGMQDEEETESDQNE